MSAIIGGILRMVRRLPFPRTLTSAIGLVMVLGGVALAVAPGLLNPSFEDSGSDHLPTNWNASVVHNGVYNPATCAEPEGVCVVGEDNFTVTDDVYGSQEETVTPIDGDHMLRLGGPFTNDSQSQSLDRYIVRQTFTVDPANPILHLNYNVFTFDYTGFDDLIFKVKLTDQDGDVIAAQHQGSFGPEDDTHLKTTGWRPTHIDLSAYAGQQVHLQISSGGTSDNLYGFWAYIDAGTAPEPPVGTPHSTTATDPVTHAAVPINSFTDPGTGQTWITIPNSSVNHFPSSGSTPHCMPLTMNVPIDPGSGTVSNVHLLFDKDSGGTDSIAMNDGDHDNVWTGTINCAENGYMYVQYSVTEGTNTQQFSVPLGGIVLIDPSGTVFDKRNYDTARSHGQSEAQARATAAVSGASVRLQRCSSTSASSCANVLSGDPGIAPNVNPEVTGSDGHYEWDVNSSHYRVVVTKAGYDTYTGPIVVIPPPRTDLHVPLNPHGYTGPPHPTTTHTTTTTQSHTASTTVNNQTSSGGTKKKKACAGLHGKKLKKCKAKQKVKKALAKCGKLHGKKRKACRAKVLALAKCDKLKSKKRTTCRRKVQHHGRKH